MASLYTPRAVAYRLNKGIRDEDIAMSVACLHGGIRGQRGDVFPPSFHIMEDQVVITAVWGLGPYAVDGVITPDTYRVAKDRDLTMLDQRFPRSRCNWWQAGRGLKEIPVAPELQDAPCLTPEQIHTLAGYAVSLENHYQSPQDIEWALDPAGRLLVLQTRPLRLQAPTGRGSRPSRRCGYPLLVEGGAVAFPGVGCGPAFHVQRKRTW